MRLDHAVDWQFERRRSWDAVWDPAFLERWQRLFDGCDRAHVFHRPALVRAWAETCGRAAGAQPIIGIGSHRNGAEVLVPWVLTPAIGRLVRRRQLGFAGGDLFGYHDPLCSADPATIDWAAFWSAARRSVADACDQALFRFVHAEFAESRTERCDDDSPVLRLRDHDGFDALMTACSISHRGDVGRQRRRLSARGPIELWVAAPSDGERALADWRARAEPAYREVWTRRARANTCWRPGFDDFVARIITDGIREGWGHYATLMVGGEPIAWHVGLAHRGRLYWCYPAHHGAWEPYSPGKLLLAAVVESLFAGGWSELHFQTGRHAYKMAWRPELADLRVVRWHAPGLRGRLLSVYDALRDSA